MDDRGVVEQVERLLADSPRDAVAAYVFGSVGRAESTPDSDVDIAVLFDPPPPSRLGALPQRLEGDIERVLGRPAQVVVLNTAPADLVHRVLRDGVVVLDRDRAARLRFEVERRNEYFDLLPVLQRYRAGAEVT